MNRPCGRTGSGSVPPRAATPTMNTTSCARRLRDRRWHSNVPSDVHVLVPKPVNVTLSPCAAKGTLMGQVILDAPWPHVTTGPHGWTEVRARGGDRTRLAESLTCELPGDPLRFLGLHVCGDFLEPPQETNTVTSFLPQLPGSAPGAGRTAIAWLCPHPRFLLRWETGTVRAHIQLSVSYVPWQWGAQGLAKGRRQ